MKSSFFDLNRHARCLLDSYRHWTGRELIECRGSPEDWVRQLNVAPFVLLSHGTEVDPILNYGNRLALELWEMGWEEFTATSSRLTAEAPDREERARQLIEVAEKGYMENYSGVRVSKSGRRFRISRATLWNLLDEAGLPAGQAAWFDHWTEL